MSRNAQPIGDVGSRRSSWNRFSNLSSCQTCAFVSGPFVSARSSNSSSTNSWNMDIRHTPLVSDRSSLRHSLQHTTLLATAGNVQEEDMAWTEWFLKERWNAPRGSARQQLLFHAWKHVRARSSAADAKLYKALILQSSDDARADALGRLIGRRPWIREALSLHTLKGYDHSDCGPRCLTLHPLPPYRPWLQ